MGLDARNENKSTKADEMAFANRKTLLLFLLLLLFIYSTLKQEAPD